MELWVRSQDKEQLRKIVDLKYQKGTIEDDNCEAIIGTTQYDEWEVLGIYTSKERALEVLDDIQNFIAIRKELTGDYETQDIEVKAILAVQLAKVYEMPKE